MAQAHIFPAHARILGVPGSAVAKTTLTKITA
jgi:hypothetical protein